MNVDFLKCMLSLAGCKAVVTGAGSGIGRAAALSLANFGAEVFLLGRRMEKLSKTEEEINKAGAKSKSYGVDISDCNQVEEFFDFFRHEHQHLDVFVANAGQILRADVFDTSEEEFDRINNINFKGTWRCLKHAGEIMRKQRRGNIIVVTSVNGMRPMPNQAIYSSTKFALQGLTLSLAATLAPYGVRVNSCAPGSVITDFNKDIFSVESVRRNRIEEIPLGFIAEPMDIGVIIAFLATDACRFMTGSTVLIDGGESLRKSMKQN
ncbi:MAG: SDR family oxidoreductase [Prevotellaceae bacterium]|jgi:NAD(P)-dependent dehydrogenase (short-subunit alcohol dehydrogenase family)|nr:SDR family oxidoreductase [Prevotellaceae bacterium]